MNRQAIRLEPGAEPVPGFRLVRFLGQGGCGAVWLAEGPGEVPRALKFLPSAERAADRELQSLKLLENVSHPHLIGIVGSWPVPGYLVVGMELADAGCLWDRFVEAKESGQVGIPCSELLEYFDQAAKAIDFLESRALQHGDIKPQNLLLTSSGLKVSDFGQVRLLEHTLNTHTGAGVTYAYSPPEFLDRKTAKQSDQYALAVTWRHLRGGRLPFSGTPAQVMMGHMQQAPDLTMLPPEEHQAVTRALAKKPEDRWPTCRAFVEALRWSMETPNAEPIDSWSLPIDEPSSPFTSPDGETFDSWSVAFDEPNPTPADPWGLPITPSAPNQAHVEFPDQAGLPPLPPLPPLEMGDEASTTNDRRTSVGAAQLPPKTSPIPEFFIDPFAALREACSEQPLDWEKIDRLAREASLAASPMPIELIDKVDESSRRVQARTLLQQAIHQAKGPKSVAAAYQSALLDDWPACALLVHQAKEAFAVVAVLDKLEALVRNPNDGRELIRLWAQHRSRLSGLADAAAVKAAAEKWDRQVQACETFLAILNRPGSEREIASAWDRVVVAGIHPEAAAQRTRAEQAKVRAACLDALQSIPDESNETNDVQWQQTWKDDLLQNCREAEPLRPRHSAVLERLRLLAELRQAIENSDQGTGSEGAVVVAASQLPQGYRHQAHLRVETARVRLDDTRALLRALKVQPSSDRTIAKAWERLDAVERNRLEAALGARCRLSVQRRDCLDHLAKIPDEVNETQDVQWYQSWKDDLLRDCPEAEPLRQRQSAVLGRLRLLAELRLSIKSADQGTGNEGAVVAVAARLPQGYRYRAQARVQTARLRLADNRALIQALQTQPPSDRAIARAFEKLDAIERARLDATLMERCQLAVKRRDCLDGLTAIPTIWPDDEEDSEWIAKWNESLLQDCSDADPLRDRHRLARERLAAWRALEECLKEADLKNIAARASHPLLVDYPPVVRQRGFIDLRLAQAEKLIRLHRLLEKHLEGLTRDDLDFLREFPKIVAAERPRIESELLDWLNREANRLKTGSPPWIVDAQTGQVRVKWTWPSFDLIGKCWLAVHEKKVQSPEEVGGLISQFDPESHRRHQGSGGVPLGPLMPAGTRSVWVAVWPIIDLGWLKVVGNPLHLGPISPGTGAPGSGRYSGGSTRRGN